MTALWPEFLVLVLFLAGDLLWSGIASAAAGLAAGILSFLVLLLFGRRKPGLIAEGVVFGGVTALGEIVSFPGGTVILMELVLGLILLVSVLFRWNIMEKMAGGMGKGFISSEGQGVLTAAMGAVFTLHSMIYAVLDWNGAGGLLTGISVFAGLYLIALRLSSKRIREAERAALPVIMDGPGDRSALKKNGSVLGTMILNDRGRRTAAITEPTLGVAPGEFLRDLEICLRRAGFRFLVLDDWQEDVLELEMDGFTKVQGCWKKPL